MEEQVYFCWGCKCQVRELTCPKCGNSEDIHSYERIVCVHAMKRHGELPGMALLPINEVDNIRDGPIEAMAAVRRFDALRYNPEKTLVFFYPTGLKSLNFTILLGLKDLGYPVVVWYWDSKTKSYF